jgi:hypothetical protein
MWPFSKRKELSFFRQMRNPRKKTVFPIFSNPDMNEGKKIANIKNLFEKKVVSWDAADYKNDKMTLPKNKQGKFCCYNLCVLENINQKTYVSLTQTEKRTYQGIKKSTDISSDSFQNDAINTFR